MKKKDKNNIMITMFFGFLVVFLVAATCTTPTNFRRKLEKIKYEEIQKKSQNYEVLSCSICLEDFEDKKITQTLDCGHKYCKTCIDTWIHKYESCPICREKTVTNSEKDPEISFRLRSLQRNFPSSITPTLVEDWIKVNTTTYTHKPINDSTPTGNNVNYDYGGDGDSGPDGDSISGGDGDSW